MNNIYFRLWKNKWEVSWCKAKDPRPKGNGWIRLDLSLGNGLRVNCIDWDNQAVKDKLDESYVMGAE